MTNIQNQHLCQLVIHSQHYSSISSIINVLYVRNVLNSDGKFFLLHMSNTWLNVIPLPKQAATPAASLSRLNLNHSARFEVLTEMKPKTQVFCNMTLSGGFSLFWGIIAHLSSGSSCSTWPWMKALWSVKMFGTNRRTTASYCRTFKVLNPPSQI